MRKRSLNPLAAIALCMATMVSLAANAGTIVVKLDQAKIIRLPPGAQTLVVGNPIIADVTMLKAGGNVVVTGKGFGSTNLIVLDKAGNVVTESTIQVEAETGSILIVQRGDQRESYSCKPRCQPTYQLGDSKSFTGETAEGISSHNKLADPGNH